MILQHLGHVTIGSYPIGSWAEPIPPKARSLEMPMRAKKSRRTPMSCGKPMFPKAEATGTGGWEHVMNMMKMCFIENMWIWFMVIIIYIMLDIYIYLNSAVTWALSIIYMSGRHVRFRRDPLLLRRGEKRRPTGWTRKFMRLGYRFQF